MRILKNHLGKNGKCTPQQHGSFKTFTFERKHINLTSVFFSFPGGKKDPEDKSVIETAVREMEEEMGLEKSRVQVWAQMPAMPDRVITSVFKENGLNPGVSVVHIVLLSR